MTEGDLLNRISTELEFKAIRSSGPGGQSVNKLSTKVELRWNILNSTAISTEERQLILSKLSNNVNNDGYLVITDQQSRSQLQNKEQVIKKLAQLVTQALKVEMPRKPTKRTTASVKKRLENKRKNSLKKQQRRKPE